MLDPKTLRDKIGSEKLVSCVSCRMSENCPGFKDCPYLLLVDLTEKHDKLAEDLYLARFRINSLVYDSLGVLHRAAVTHPRWVNGNLILKVTTKALTEEEQSEVLDGV